MRTEKIGPSWGGEKITLALIFLGKFSEKILPREGDPPPKKKEKYPPRLLSGKSLNFTLTKIPTPWKSNSPQ